MSWTEEDFEPDLKIGRTKDGQRYILKESFKDRDWKMVKVWKVGEGGYHPQGPNCEPVNYEIFRTKFGKYYSRYTWGATGVVEGDLRRDN